MFGHNCIMFLGKILYFLHCIKFRENVTLTEINTNIFAHNCIMYFLEHFVYFIQ